MNKENLIEEPIESYYSNRDSILRELFEKELEKYISGKKIVLNLGCGDGWETRVIQNYANTLISSDISKDQLKKFLLPRENRSKIILRSDWDVAPFRDNTFDAIVVFNSIHHSHDLVITLDEIYRILKPGGLLLCTKEPVCPFILSMFWKTRLQQEHGHLEGAEKEGNYTIYEWKSNFLESNFRKVQISPSEMTIQRYLKSDLMELNRRYRGGKLNWDEKIARRTEIFKIVPFRILNSISEPLAKKILFTFQKNLFAMHGITIIAVK